MPSPTSSLATLRPDLGASFMEFDLEADRLGFIGRRVFPVLDVALAGDSFGKIPIEQLLQNPETARAEGSNYNSGKWNFTTDSYACAEHGWEEPIDDRQRKRYRHFFDVEQIATMRAMHIVLKAQEKRVADAIFNATVFTGAALTTPLTNEWDDHANALPVTDVDAAVKAVWEGCGLWPNALIINRRVFRNLRRCDEIIELVKYSGHTDPRPGKITPAWLSEVFDLPHIFVAGGTQNTANEAKDASISQVWSDEYAMVCRVCETNDIQEPGLGRTFHWDEDGSEIDGRVESYRSEDRRSDIVRVRNDTHEKTLYIQAGHLLSNVTT